MNDFDDDFLNGAPFDDGPQGVDDIKEPVGNEPLNADEIIEPVGNEPLNVDEIIEPDDNEPMNVDDIDEPVGNEPLNVDGINEPVGNEPLNVDDIIEPDVDEEDPVRQVTIEDNHDPVTLTWTHPNMEDPRIDDPNLIPHPGGRVSGGGSTIDGAYISPDVINDPMTAREDLALNTFDKIDENGNAVGQTQNTATEITTGTVYTNVQNEIIGSDGQPTGQTFDPQIVEPQGNHPGGGMEIKLNNPDDFVKEQTTINKDLNRDINWGTYVAQEHKAETIAKIQQNKDAYYSNKGTLLSPNPDDGGTADNVATISSNPTPEEETTDISQSTEVFGNAGTDPYANNPDSHFVQSDQKYLDPQSENTEFTNLRAVRELNIFKDAQRD